jgi:MoxR-like ATPase
MSYDAASEQVEKQIQDCVAVVARLGEEIGKRIVGQRHLVERLIVSLVAEGHILLEGLPGLAKTTSIKAVADAADLKFSRIQFTPDLLPADVMGTQIYNPKTSEFTVKRGPVFANLVLADEINRAPAKVQAALLEAMQERQVTIGDQTFRLERPFLVMATQNPIEQEGTYPLPEAQVDRFLFKVRIDYPTPDEEADIIARLQSEVPALTKVAHAEDIRRMTALAGKVHVADKVRRYIVQVVHATRHPGKAGIAQLANMITVGASPRASISLDVAARVNALFNGRSFVTPQDVKDVAYDALRHRIIPSYEAEAEGLSPDAMITTILERVDVP